MASDVGYVLLVPLGAIIFLSVGRHPIAGLAAAFAGVSGGFSANLLLGTIDPLLAGHHPGGGPHHRSRATPSPRPATTTSWSSRPSSIAALGTWVTEKIVDAAAGRLCRANGTAAGRGTGSL